MKKFVELHVETKPFGSNINPSSTPNLSASIHALIQFILLNELILGSCTMLSLFVFTEANRIPISKTSLFGFLYSGMITIVGSPIVTFGC